MSDDGIGHRDVNEGVVEEWLEETTPFERVYGIVRRIYEPEPASEIADRARVSPTTARKHLRTLVDAGAVSTAEDGQATLYRRSETAIVTEHARHLLAEHTSEELAEGIAEMKTRIREWRETYDVESPEELARKLDVDDANGSDVVTAWQTTRRNLELAQAALAIGEATRSGRLTDGDGDVSLTA